jgi:outer membrane protein TolC
MRVLWFLAAVACAPRTLVLDERLPALRLQALSAQVDRAEASSWTLQEALASARVHSPWLVAGRHWATAAEEGVAAARTVDNPQLRFGLNDLGSTVVGPTVELDLRIPLTNPAIVSARVRAARAEAAAATSDADALQALVEAEVTDLYLAVAAQPAQRALWDRLIAGRRALAERAERGRALGLATAVDAVRAQRAVTEAVADAEGWAAEVALEREALCAHLGVPAGSDLDLAPVDLAPVSDLEIEAALARRPDVRAALARVEAARSARAEASATAWPWVDFVQIGLNAPDGEPVEPQVQVAVRVPIWSLGRGEVRAAKAEEAARLAELDAVVLQTAQLVAVAQAAVEASERVVTEADGAVRRVRQALQSTQAPELVVELQLEEVRAEMALQQATLAAARARAALAAALGW